MRGQTARFDGPDLCESCRSGMVIKGVAEQELIKVCHQLEDSRPIPFKVAECSGYSNKTSMTKSDMEKIAQIMVFKKGSGFIGFQSANKFREENKLEKYDDLAPDLPGVD